MRRRDFTINAMAVDEYGNLHDPFGGRKDLSNKTIKHVSPAFVEDPLRVIRLGRFLAQLTEFNVHKDTYELCKEIVKNKEILTLSKERIWTEISKGFGGRKPINMINFLLVVAHGRKLLDLLTSVQISTYFLKVLKLTKVSLEWIVANIFQDEELEKCSLYFSKGSSHCNKCIEKNKSLSKNYIDAQQLVVISITSFWIFLRKQIYLEILQI